MTFRAFIRIARPARARRLTTRAGSGFSRLKAPPRPFLPATRKTASAARSNSLVLQMNDTTKAAVDYSASLYLPQTDFPMRAGLPQQEPEILARWEEIGLYGETARSRAGAAPNSCCTTARLTPTATSISATRSTRSSRTW